MALAAIPQSQPAFTRKAGWDEVIVPALRQRLENESAMLTKRMSAASMDGADALSSNSTYSTPDRAVSPSSQSSKRSAIPRPSLQQSATGDSSRVRSGSGTFQQRGRTLSQPFPFHESVNQNPPPLPLDASSRSNSPMMSATRSTRIPISRARTGSVTSNNQPSLNGAMLNARGDSRSGFHKANGRAYGAELQADLYSVDESHQPSSVGSHSTLKSLRSGVSEIVNERPPFSASQVSVRRGYDDDFDAPRMSTDSEERPFEHWYRGDVSRNGGVGELRVGKRQEMLEIANYGHTLREASSRTAISTSRSRSNSRGRDGTTTPGRGRQRAGSVGARESLYLQDEKLQHGSFVLDERPPTDLESDEDAYDEDEDVEYYEEPTASYDRGAGAVSPHSLDRSDTPTLVDLKSSGFKSRIPTPTPRTTTPTQSLPRRSDSPSTPKASHFTIPQPTPKVSSKPAATPAVATAKRKAKSPAPTPAVKAKRQKAPPKPKAAPKKKDDRSRESVAEYPAPEGDDIMHAVPSWTQPVPPSGNWDDVVLPVVARKKGLEEHYQTADGRSKPRSRPTSDVFAPAPGTFGFDHTKYRPPRTKMRAEEIQMEEFGQRTDDIIIIAEEQPRDKVIDQEPSPTSPLAPPPRIPGTGSPRSESPAPFSQYSATPSIPEIRVTRPSADMQQKLEVRVEEGGRDGCCKCIIM